MKTKQAAKPKQSKSRILADLLQQSNGTFFSCVFTKKNGEQRTVNARFMPSDKPAPNSKDYLTVYVPKVGYRSIHKDSILAVATKGIQAVI